MDFDASDSTILKSSNFLSRLLIETSNAVEHPAIYSVYGALAFCDISGFTALTSDYARRGSTGIEDLGKLLNNHYEGLISTMSAHGGDVIAIIGDAAMVLFSERPKPFGDLSSSRMSRGDSRALMTNCVRAIDACMDALQSNKMGLAMHIGVSCGVLHVLHIGGWQGKSQFLLAGEPLKHLQSVVGSAKSGTVCVTDQVHSLISSGGINFSSVQVAGGGWIIAKTGSFGLHVPASLTTAGLKAQPIISEAPEVGPRHDILLSAYLCDSVVGRYLGLDTTESQSGVDWLAEWRRLTIIFVKLRDFESINTMEDVQSLHQCFVAIQKASQSHDGSLLHAFNDDKGVLAMLAFGLPLKAHENDPSRAVACALSLHADLSRRGMKVAMGMTTGYVFCGCLGSSKRKDFTVLGSLVNLASRLMSAAPTDTSTGSCPILCDESTKNSCHGAFLFSDPQQITAKGFADPVLAYTPYDPLTDRAFGKSSMDLKGATLIGRDKELSTVNDAVDAWIDGLSPVVFISGDAGMGKSTLTSSVLLSLSDKRAHPSSSDFQRARRASLLASRKPHIVFYIKSDPFVGSDFHVWADVTAQSVDFLMAEESINGFGPNSRPVSSQDPRPETANGGEGSGTGDRRTDSAGSQGPFHAIESFLRSLFSRRFSALLPYLSLLNPLLHTHFADTKQSENLAAISRSEMLFEIVQCIILCVLHLVPLCICIEDAHALDPASWNFASKLARSCFEKSRMKREASLKLRHSFASKRRLGNFRSVNLTNYSFPPVAGNDEDSANAAAAAAAAAPDESEESSQKNSPGRAGLNPESSSEELNIYSSQDAFETANGGGEKRPSLGKLFRKRAIEKRLRMSVSSSSAVVLVDNESPKRATPISGIVSAAPAAAVTDAPPVSVTRFAIPTDASQPSNSESSPAAAAAEISPPVQPLLFLLNARASKMDFRDDEGYQQFLGISNELCFVKLPPLLEESVGLIVGSVFPGVTGVDPPVCSLIHKMSQGNALFIKELSLSLFQQQIIVINDDNFVAFKQRRGLLGGAQEAIPQTIHDVIRSRIDALPADQQMLIKVASVVGTVFGLETLVAIHPSHVTPHHVEQWVKDIAKAGLCSVSADGSEASFNHHLTQEVSYSLLTPSQRVELHRKLAQFLENPPTFCPIHHFRFSQLAGPSPFGSRNGSSSDGGGGMIGIPFPTIGGGGSAPDPPFFTPPGSATAQTSLNFLNPSALVSNSTSLRTSFSNSDLPGQVTSMMDEAGGSFLGGPPRAITSRGGLGTANGDTCKCKRKPVELYVLAHHWVRGKVHDKARLCLAQLAVEAHHNYKNREAITWFTELFEQEEHCCESTDPLTLSKWCRNLGEAYYLLGDFTKARVWLEKALVNASFDPPKTALALKWRILKELWIQYRSRKSNGKRSKSHPNKQQLAFLKEQVKAMHSLSMVYYFLNETHWAIFNILFGANCCETSSELDSESSIFYAYLAHALGGMGPKTWADIYADLAYKRVSTEFNKLKVVQGIMPYFVWSCALRCEKELSEGLALCRANRCWKEYNIILALTIEYCYHHALTNEYQMRISEIQQEAETREDVQAGFYCCTKSAIMAMMTDDRPTTAMWVKTAVAEFPKAEKSVESSLLPAIAAHLLFRDTQWPTPASPHMSFTDCDKVIKFMRPNRTECFRCGKPVGEDGVCSAGQQSPQKPQNEKEKLQSISGSGDELNNSRSFFNIATATGSSARLPISDGSSPRSVVETSGSGCGESLDTHQQTLQCLSRLIESALCAIPDQPHGVGFFHTFHLCFELHLLHGVPCDSNIISRAMKIFRKLENHYTLFKPMILAWSAVSALQKNPKKSSAFDALHMAVAIAQQHSLPLQEAFCHFLLSRAIGDLMIPAKSGHLSPKQVKSISKCDGRDHYDRLNTARGILLGIGHTFYATMFSDLSGT